MNKNDKTKISTNIMVRAAFLTAISIVLTRFLSIMIPIGGTNSLRIGFGAIPIKVSGFLFGPLVGGLSGLASDLIGVVINPQGPYHPGFTISATLGGIIPGLFGLYYRKNPKEDGPFNFFRIGLSGIVVTIFVSILLNTLWLSQIGGNAYLVLLPLRVFSNIMNFIVHTIVTTYLLKYLGKIDNIY